MLPELFENFAAMSPTCWNPILVRKVDEVVLRIVIVIVSTEERCQCGGEISSAKADKRLPGSMQLVIPPFELLRKNKVGKPVTETIASGNMISIISK